ncbi:tyrosine-type recombinase/integrase [Pseudosulfitobacter pseudonitzschiae]|uniref:tyrosine-type recombinase/integrase n=2 Tax=Roseobacteraceae TaxID=2854170 RepID=UPI000B7A30F2
MRQAHHVQRTCRSCLPRTPHVLRHTAAMQLLQSGVDRTIIALWLGHESVETTQVYIHADIELKERAMALTMCLLRCWQ